VIRHRSLEGKHDAPVAPGTDSDCRCALRRRCRFAHPAGSHQRQLSLPRTSLNESALSAPVTKSRGNISPRRLTL